MRVRKIARIELQIRHVRPPVSMEKLSFKWTDFHGI